MEGFQKAKDRFRTLSLKVKRQEGNPHFIALGFALGVFVSVTPTIPFHTVFAVGLAFLFKGSKAAAALGVWFSNPLTIPLFYFLSYRLGAFLFGVSFSDTHPHTILELMKMGLDLTLAMVAGGVLLGILPGIAAYFVMRRLIRRWQKKRKEASRSKISKAVGFTQGGGRISREKTQKRLEP